jgi:hypothetical protein
MLFASLGAKEGSFQSEIRYGRIAWAAFLDEIPDSARLDDCHVPWKIRREIHYIDMFPI